MLAGVMLFLLLFFAMLAWFAYVATKDPAGIFKPRPRDPEGEDNPPAP